jgi:hypothetical protein
MGQFLGPAADKICQFLGPAADTIRPFLAPIVFSRILANRKRKRKIFEHALDYV